MKYIGVSAAISAYDYKTQKKYIRSLVKQSVPSNLSKYKQRQLTQIKSLIKQGKIAAATKQYQSFIGITKRGHIRKGSIAEKYSGELWVRTKKKYLDKQNELRLVNIQRRFNTYTELERKAQELASQDRQSLDDLSSYIDVLKDYNVFHHLSSFTTQSNQQWINRVRKALGIGDDVSNIEVFRFINRIIGIAKIRR